jgi:ribokinase
VRLELLCVGATTFDNFFWVDKLPKTHFESEIKERGRFYGGRAPNVAAVTAKLGMRTGLCTAVGTDFVASGYSYHLSTLGVSLDGVKVRGKKTKEVFVYTDKKGSQILFISSGAEFPNSLDSRVRDIVRKSDWIHLTSSGNPSFVANLLAGIRGSDATLSFDPGNEPIIDNREYLLGVLERAKVLFANDAEVSKILGVLRIKSAGQLHRFGPEIIVSIRKRDKSAEVFVGSERRLIETAVREIVDPSGGSDGFVAGFIFGYRRGYSLDDAARLGSCVAAFVMESRGCQTNIPSVEMLVSRFKHVYGRPPQKA